MFTTPINLQPPTQVIPTSNARGTPMVERQPGFNTSQYVSQFQLQHPGQGQRPNVLDHTGTRTSQGHQYNVTLPAKEDISLGQNVVESEHELSPSQHASTRRLLNDELPVPLGLNDLQPVNLPRTEQQFALSQYPLETQQLVHSQLANQSGQFLSLSEGLHPVQQSVPQQSVLHHPLQPPPVLQKPTQQPPPQLVPSIQSTSQPPETQHQPAIRGELYKNLIQQETITTPRNESEIRPIIIEQRKPQSVSPPQSSRIPPPLEVPMVNTAEKDPLLSSDETLPNILASSPKSQGPKEIDSQLSPREMHESTPIPPPQDCPRILTTRNVANSPTTKKSDLKWRPPLTYPQQSLEAPKIVNTKRQTLLAVLKSIRPPLTERESSAIDRILSLEFNRESLFAALVLEHIISSKSLGIFRTAFTRIDAISGSTAAPVRYHSALRLSSNDAPAQTTTAPPNSSSKRSHSTLWKPESKSSTRKLPTKQTQSTALKSSLKRGPLPTKMSPPKQLRLPMPSPVLKEKITKLFLQYAVETSRPEYIGSITSIAKTAKTILQLETAIKDRGIFSAQEIVKVEQRAVMELRNERENEQSSHSASDQGVSGIGETSLENTSSPTAKLKQDADVRRISTPDVSASHVQPVSQNPASKGYNVSTLHVTNVKKANAGAPSNVSAASQAPSKQNQLAKFGRPPNVRTATQNPSTDGSNQVANGSNQMNGANVNNVTTSTNGAPLNSSVSNGKEDISDPSAPLVQQRRPRKLRVEKSIIAQAVPCRADLDLSNTIASWPENQIARNILIAAGREIPGRDSSPLNEEFECIKTTWPELKKADLRTLEWDIIDPPRVDLLAAIRKTLEITKKLPKNFMKSGRGRPPINRSSLNRSSFPSTQSGAGEFTKYNGIDNSSSSEPLKTQPLDVPPPMFTGNGVAETATTSMSTPGGNSPGGFGTGTLRRQSSHSASPVAPGRCVPNPPSTISTPTTPTTRGRKPKSDLAKTPVQITEVTPRKVTPQIVITSPKKSTTMPCDSIADDDTTDITPTKSSWKNALPRQSATTRLVKRTSTSPIAKNIQKRSSLLDLRKEVLRAKRTPSLASTIDLKTTIPPAIPLNSADSSDDEPLISTPPKPVKKQTGYKSYPCRWQACRAELHSLDTLEKHVTKVHGNRDPATNVSSKLSGADYR